MSRAIGDLARPIRHTDLQEPAHVISMQARISFAAALLTAICVLSAGRIAAAQQPRPLELEPGDRIVFIGNTFAERMIDFGYFESLLTLLYPEHDLVFRNLGWSADELTRQRIYVPKIRWKEGTKGWSEGDAMLQPRPLNFGDVHIHLALQKADVIFACFGTNESFRGSEGLVKFEDDLRHLTRTLKQQKYNGESPPRLVLVSPIPHERLGPLLPDPSEHNVQLEAYTATMRQVAVEEGVSFVDLFAPISALLGEGLPENLTFNGIHLTQYGDWIAAQVMIEGLRLGGQEPRIEINADGSGAAATGARIIAVGGSAGQLRLEVADLVLPVAPSPLGSPHRRIADLGPTLLVRNLKPGRYALTMGQAILAEADESEWAAGVHVASSPPDGKAEQVRQVGLRKNRRFFYRWRAVNGEYVYGRRKEPFGVKNFPGEMEKLDEMVSEGDRTAHRLARQPQTHVLQLKRVGP